MAASDWLRGIGGAVEGGLDTYGWLDRMHRDDQDRAERARERQAQADRERQANADRQRREISSMLSSLGQGTSIGQDTARQAREAGLGELVEWTPGRLPSESVAGTVLPPLAEGYRVRDPQAGARENAGIDKLVGEQRETAATLAELEQIADPYARKAAELQVTRGLNIPVSSLIPLDVQAARKAAEAAEAQKRALDEYEAKKRIDRRYDRPPKPERVDPDPTFSRDKALYDMEVERWKMLRPEPVEDPLTGAKTKPEYVPPPTFDEWRRSRGTAPQSPRTDNVGAVSPDVQTQAETLIAKIRTEKNPQRLATLKQQLAAIRRQLVGGGQ